MKMEAKRVTSCHVVVLLIATALFVGACGTMGGGGNHAKKDARHGAHWGYSGEGGPEYWGELSEKFKACSEGNEQSPVDITGAVAEELGELVLEYNALSDLKVVNNGHTIKVAYKGGGGLKINGSEYDILQFHFHAPSEHIVDGNSYAMEGHLVHINDAGELAVVGVLFEVGDENDALSEIWSVMPKEAGKKDKLGGFDVSRILPAERGYYTYSGSLTTPPCSENVMWFVLKEPLTISKAQKEALVELFDLNNRPVQPINKRTIKATT